MTACSQYFNLNTHLPDGSKRKILEQPAVGFGYLNGTEADTGGDGMNSESKTETPQPREWSERETVHTPVVPEQNARQGVTGQNVRYVLGFGLAAVVIVFFVIWLAYFA
jgi:hypothetical protein